MTTTQLSLYNEAAILLGDRQMISSDISAPTRELPRVLNAIWADGTGVIDYCLEQGLWVFAMRTQQYTYSPSLSPSPYAYKYGFNLPADHIRTAGIAIDPYFNAPLTQYEEEGGNIWCDWQTIYLKWISNDSAFGGDMSLWPNTFSKFVASYLAWEASLRITQDDKKQDRLEKIMTKRLLAARSRSAMEDPAKFPPLGAWAGARFGRYWKGNKMTGAGWS